ncbi:MAG: oligosaccharide repeat unit polymerase [Candidatus Cloacimonetes bacterium]|nr:oligosaccharide repeat unit polymerase [Candidatus Cloacimonadota bacterium]
MDPVLLKALIFANLGLYSLIAGYKLIGNKSITGIMRILSPKFEQTKKDISPIYLLLLFLLGITGIVLLYKNLDYLTLYFQYISSRILLRSGTGYYSLLANLMIVCAYGVFVYYYSKKKKLNLWVLLPPLILGSAFLLISATRLRLILLFATIFVSSKLIKKKKFVNANTIILMVGAIVIIFSLGIIRSADFSDMNNFFQNNRDLIQERTGETLKYMFTKDFGHMDTQISIYERYPKWFSHLYGKTYLAFLAMPIPRSVFPGKPTGAGPIIANAIEPGKWSLNRKFSVSYTPTMFGELYMNFGLIVSLLVMCLIGFLYKKIYCSFLKVAHEPLSVFLYVIFLLYFVMNCYFNEFVGGFTYFFEIFISLFIFKYFLNYRKTNAE